MLFTQSFKFLMKILKFIYLAFFNNNGCFYKNEGPQILYNMNWIGVA